MIHMPSNTPYGFIIGALSFVFGFAMIWYMYALAVISMLAIIAFSIIPLFNKHREYDLSEKVVEKIEKGARK